MEVMSNDLINQAWKNINNKHIKYAYKFLTRLGYEIIWLLKIRNKSIPEGNTTTNLIKSYISIILGIVSVMFNL